MKWFIISCVALFFSATTVAQSDSWQSQRYVKKNAYYLQKTQKVFYFSPRDKRWAAYENGRKVKSGPANGGKPGYRTPQGVFYVMNKQGPYHVSSVDILFIQMAHAAALRCHTQCILPNKVMLFMAHPLFQIKTAAMGVFVSKHRQRNG